MLSSHESYLKAVTDNDRPHDQSEAPLDEERFYSELASVIHARGFSMGAIFFLEMSKPLAGIVQAACVGVQPLWTMLFGPEKIKQLRWMSEDRSRIERLILAIEEQSHGR